MLYIALKCCMFNFIAIFVSVHDLLRSYFQLFGTSEHDNQWSRYKCACGGEPSLITRCAHCECHHWYVYQTG